MFPTLLFLTLLLTGFPVIAAPTPSFDCAAAAYPIEIIICDHEKLAQADKTLGEAYAAARKRATEAQRNALQNGQRQWLAERLERCHIGNKKGQRIKDPNTVITCLLDMYQARLGELTPGSTRSSTREDPDLPPGSTATKGRTIPAKNPTGATPRSPDTPPRVESTSPKGMVKAVRQITVRFSNPMVPLGDPRLQDPFTVSCPTPGKGRWADNRNWLYDFDADVPAATQCRVNLKEGVTTLAGQPLDKGGDFTFTTAGPTIITSQPTDGDNTIEEDQVFLLGLNALVDPATLESKVHCQIPGIGEKIGVRILTPEERKPLLISADGLIDHFLDRLSGPGGQSPGIDPGLASEAGTEQQRFLKRLHTPDVPIVALQCKRHLAPGSEVSLIWGAGIAARSGVSTATDQVIRFKVREAFQAHFYCERVNKDAGCVPVRPLSLAFNTPIALNLAQKITLKGHGETRTPRIQEDEVLGQWVQRVTFPQPFPEKSTFQLELPAELRDDAGRTLVNQGEFPLTVAIDEYPPLAKFPASFGILEAQGEPALPVTIRNLETVVSADPDHPEKDPAADENAQVRGRLFKVDNPQDFPTWIKRVQEAQREKSHTDPASKETVIDQLIGESSVFGAAEIPALTTFTLPKPNGAKSFDVMGIPLPKPGFYVVELASQRLGAALHGKPKPYFAQAAALVTNLAAHFFQGRESSLVWVTALDSGRPVSGADVRITDCSGHLHARGPSDKDGLFFIHQELPANQKLAACPSGERAYIVSARLEGDVTFTLSSWNNGIERWAFNLPGPSSNKPVRVHTILDRSLFRTGETVHMKHLLRRHDAQGFSYVDQTLWPKKAIIRHAGGGSEYPLNLTWDPAGVAESTLKLPKEAKLGTYDISLDGMNAGSFHVEAFRVPLMKGVVKPVKSDLVRATRAEWDLQVSYLAGGAASLAPVKVRGILKPKTISFHNYEGFTFTNGMVAEGKVELGRSRHDDSEESGGARTRESSKERPLAVVATNLDQAGGARVTVSGWKEVQAPQSLHAEMEYRDPNGETLVSSAQATLWPSAVVPGIKPNAWLPGQDKIQFQVVTLNTSGQVLSGIPVTLDIFQRKTYSHRKRLLGGFYSYDQYDETKKIKEFCSGKSDERGMLVCEGTPPIPGNLIVQARVTDAEGNAGYAHAEVWVPEEKDSWFAAREGDRMDLLPEKRHYEPGDQATLQVRMPFREATGLIVMEREGVMETYVQPLQGQSPRVTIPIQGHHGPNVFVAVLAVRGRSGEVQPTAVIDMGRPAMRLGIAQLQVGWSAYALKVGVKADRETYKTREQADVTVMVHRDNGKPLPGGGEIALAAVDEGLLELLPNGSWNLLEDMMTQRGLEVETATAMGRVLGKRHFGKKAVSQGGGGGRNAARELFDTLLLWQGRVKLDDKGMARVKVPLNDAITSFRIVAVATAGSDLFGTGATTIRATRDIVLFSGLPPVVRQGDRFTAGFTVRNAGEKPFTGQVRATLAPTEPGPLAPREIALAPGEAQEVVWEVTAPGVGKLQWDVEVAGGAASDRLKVSQEVLAAVPVRVTQATLSQLDKESRIQIAMPGDALPGSGGVEAVLASRVTDDLTGVKEYMQNYPYTCMEQRVSKAITLEDQTLWEALISALPSYLDKDGLVNYFPQTSQGSDTLTSYLLAVAATADWKIPDKSLQSMKKGLKAFVEGKIVRHSALATADLTVRKVAALAALARHEPVDPKLAGNLTIEPNLWPTSTLIDWIDLLSKSDKWPDRDNRKREALALLRSRLHFSATTMTFSTENSDYLWWLMVSPDVNANRALLAVLNEQDWREDAVRMLKGSLHNRQRGHWNTSIANAWGTLAMKKFAQTFEGVKLSGSSTVTLQGKKREISWSSQPKGDRLTFPWPKAPEELLVQHQGSGKPWLTVTTRAARPLVEPFFAGYRIQRTVTPVEQKMAGEWHRGDVLRVHLALEALSDRTWVVVDDPIPGGSTLLGGGLGKDSKIMTGGENNAEDHVWPAFVERTFDAYRAYFARVEKGSFSVEYTVRLNTPGVFQLPPTHVEAMYAPETFGEAPNATMTVLP
ncbi:MAG: Ig-like domain-containing protein [Magnetococcales bacterium]|nr:Ig-like domain-containing protein [Magnetococcales bacterium]